MRNTKLVFLFTFREAVRKRSFIITTLIISIIIIGVASIPRIIESVSPSEPADPNQTITEQDKTETCIIVDNGSLVTGVEKHLEALMPYTKLVYMNNADLEAQKEKALNEEKTYVVEVNPSEASPLPNLKVYVSNIMHSPDSTALTEGIRQFFVSNKLAEADVSADLIGLTFTPIISQTESIGTQSVGGFALGTAIIIVLFITIYYYGYGVANSIASEKTSRVMETLVVSAKPSNILLGKSMAMGCVGMLQVFICLVVTLAATSFILPDGIVIGGMPLDFSVLNAGTALLILLYFVLGYAIYAMINAVCGATISRAEDLQAALAPVGIISIASYYLTLGNMATTNKGMNMLTSYLPFTSPFRMPFKILSGELVVSELIISLLILAVSVVLITLVAIRLYSASVLHYGERIKIKNLFKMSK